MSRSRPRPQDGDHLTRNARGIWEWRRVHPVSGRRVKRSTGERTRYRAGLKAHEWNLEFERAAVGLVTLNGWSQELAPLAARWLAQLDVSPSRRAQLEGELGRALAELDLRVASDLDQVGQLDDRLRALEGRPGPSGHPITRHGLRVSYQAPLKRFSAWLAGNRRHLDRDPLASWEPITRPRGRADRRGRAMAPDEVARALLALDEIAPGGTQRLMFTVLLVIAPRAGAFVSRNVEHAQGDRIDLGEGTEKKRRGAAALDERTAEELRAALADRVGGGPLFASPRGARWSRERLLDRWREAFGLGLVDELWPSGERREPGLPRLVNDALLVGRPRVSRGGNPRRVRAETVRARERLEQRVGELAAQLREDWAARMEGVTLHAFRSTHKTWAAARGVPGAATDAQLGWSSADDPGTLAVMRAAAGSRVGRRHYLDLGSSLLAPVESARAVRAVLDEAVAALGESDAGRSAREA